MAPQANEKSQNNFNNGPENSAKRGRRRPKGSKNKPGCGNVGHPRKDGQPPKSCFDAGAPQALPPESNQSSTAVGAKPNTNVQNASAQPTIPTEPVNAKHTQGTLPKSTARAPAIAAPVPAAPVPTAPAVASDFNFGSVAVGGPLSPTFANILANLEPDMAEPGATGPLLSSYTLGKQPPTSALDDDEIEYWTPSPPPEPQPLPSSGRTASHGGSEDAGNTMDWEDQNTADGLEEGNRRLVGWSQPLVGKADGRLEWRIMVDAGVQVSGGLETEGDGLEDQSGMPEDDLCSISGSDVEEIFPEIADLPVEDTHVPLMESEPYDDFSVESDPSVQGLDEVLGRSSVNLDEEWNADLADPQPVLPVWIDGAAAMVRRQLRQEIKAHRYPLSYLHGSLSINPPNPLFVVGNIMQPTPHAFYKAQFDVWIPHLLTKTKLPCPSCHRNKRHPPVMLQQKGFATHVRRIVDIDRVIYLLGYRYACGTCKTSIISYDPNILELLPPIVQLQFTHHLTRRTGITDRLATLLRSCFQHAMGPGPFAKMIEGFHHRRYEQLHWQYLELVKERMKFSNFLAKCEPFSEFGDQSGYCGYVPRSEYFKRFYIDFSNQVVDEVDQHRQLLPVRILSIDQSFKYMPEFGRMSAAMEMHGLPPIEVCYTDNVQADRKRLEQEIPSLQRGVVPIPPLDRFPFLQLPVGWKHSVIKSNFQLNGAVNGLLDKIGNHPAVVGFGQSGQVALIQLAYDHVIYIIQLRSFITTDGLLQLPGPLMTLLRSAQVKKVGCDIGTQLARLAQDCHPSTTGIRFNGALELRDLASQRGYSQAQDSGLQDLSISVLHHRLPDDSFSTMGVDWAGPDVAESHLHAAGLDAFACLAIHATLCNYIVAGDPVTIATPQGTPISLYSRDGRVVADGIIALDHPKQFKSINVTNTQCVITISKIHIPSYLVGASLLASKTPEPISSLATSLPFNMLESFHHLRTRNPALANPIVSDSGILGSEELESDLPLVFIPSEEDRSDNGGNSTVDSDNLVSCMEEPHNVVLEVDNQSLDRMVRDPDSQERWSSAFDQLETLGMPTSIRSRVLADPWHIMNLIKIPATHGLRSAFSRALRDAIFLIDPGDRKAVEDVLATCGLTFDDMLRRNPEWVLRRVRRVIPPAEVLYPRVKGVLEMFGPMLDAATQKPLFNSAAEEKALHVLEAVYRGWVSDVPGVALYYPTGKDKDGLVKYRCIRGTNKNEGGFHQKAIRWFGPFQASIELTVSIMRDMVLKHNLMVGTANQTGKSYRSHFDIWIKNKISALVDEVAGFLVSSPAGYGVGSNSWVNGNNYAHSEEYFGILPVTEPERYEMVPYAVEHSRDQKPRHNYLAQLQRTLIAILPVSTESERSLFSPMCHTRAVDGKEPDWAEFACLWSRHANGRTIFYKLPEHLSVYYKTWLERRNESNSVSDIAQDFKHIKSLLHVHAEAAGQPVPIASALSHSESIAGLSKRPPQPPVPDLWEITDLIHSHERQHNKIQYQYLPEVQARKRKATEAQQPVQAATGPQSLAPPPAIQNRKARRCVKCQKETCEGRWRASKCSTHTDPMAPPTKKKKATK
ncbi:hypothetical protein M407DRAFT_10559 [Tulasnella calospora MUT 4182]|uniref:DUF6729 domain-containing protein n=1 Tax=Tulasnella calospora MUT 4182 TaxID=1051891 RepID=A0A0C3QAE5_9AGAM|nr:hypothetical protein M407DRAFT_10559 [Tulasnella calospora MUT 4182]